MPSIFQSLLPRHMMLPRQAYGHTWRCCADGAGMLTHTQHVGEETPDSGLQTRLHLTEQFAALRGGLVARVKFSSTEV